MKTVINNKWFRRLCQTILVGFSLVALAWAAFNWNGSRLKRDAVARMEASGWKDDLSDVLDNLPPDSSNYAMIPLLRDARLETDEASRSGKWLPVSPQAARARLAALFEDDFGKAKPRGGSSSPGEPDFSRLSPGSPYGNTAESFLREYDRRNGETLRELVAGLSLPEARRPVGADKGVNWFQLNEAFGMSMRNVTDGLGLRAYAAIVTGDPAKAVESIEVILRLSDVVGSRNFAVSQGIQRVMIAAAAQRVKQGMDRHVWAEADLKRLRASFEGIRMRERLESCMAFSARTWMDSWSRWQTDRKNTDELFSILEVDPKSSRMKTLLTVVPSGWFNMNSARHADRFLELHNLLLSSKMMAPWCIRAREMKEHYPNVPRLSKLFLPTGEILETSALLNWVASGEVIRHEAMLACDLEMNRLKSGSYPASLGELTTEALADPLHGSAFIYRRDADSFVLYSIGPDGKDDGGVREKGKSSADQADWVW